MVQLNFDASTVTPAEPRGDYPLLPEAWYSAYIDETIMKPTKANIERRNDSEYLQLRFALLDWADTIPMPMDIKISGRKFYTRLNIKNASAEAVKIAYEHLSAIGHATGVISIGTSEQLHDKPLDVFLKHSMGSDNVMRNEIAGYRACLQSQPVINANQPAANDNSQPTGNTPPVWDQ